MIFKGCFFPKVWLLEWCLSLCGCVVILVVMVKGVVL
jgi:hypothetical protein